MTIHNSIAQAVLARLRDATPTGSPAIPARADGVPNIKRIHRVPVDRDAAPEIHVVDGNDTKRGKPTTPNACNTPRTFDLTVSIFVRDDNDDVFGAADPIIEETLRRLGAGPYVVANAPTSPRISFHDCRKDVDIADGDAIRVDLTLSFDYDAVGFGLSV